MPELRVNKPLLCIAALLSISLLSANGFASFGGQILQVESFSDHYRISAMDMIEITVKDAPELSRTYAVAQQGEISFSPFGKLDVLGKTVGQVADLITGILQREDYLRKPQVTVKVVRHSQAGISISGAVNKPGTYPYLSGSTLFTLLITSGGLSDCYQPIAVITNLYNSQRKLIASIEEIAKGRLRDDIKLQPGDKVSITAEACIFIDGEVTAPGYYPFKEGITLKQAITLAGGTTPISAPDNVIILPKLADIAIPVERINLTEIMSGKRPDILLRRGDMIFVPKQSAPSEYRTPRNRLVLPGFKEIKESAPFKLRYS